MNQRSMLSALNSFLMNLLVVLALLPVGQLTPGAESSFLVGFEYISFCHDAHNNDKGIAHRLQTKLGDPASALKTGTHAQEACAGRITRIWRESSRSPAA
jgi:hypothetical protein